MSPLEAKIREVAQQHAPKGWKIVERRCRHAADGYTWGDAQWGPTIYTLPLREPYALFVFLHECGHIWHKHVLPGNPKCADMPMWLAEYEAEQYAIKAFREAGFRVDRSTMEAARENVGHYLTMDDHDEPGYREAAKFAFPKTWRDWL